MVASEWFSVDRRYGSSEISAMESKKISKPSYVVKKYRED